MSVVSDTVVRNGHGEISSGRVRADSAALRVDKHDNGPYLAVSLLFRLESIR